MEFDFSLYPDREPPIEWNDVERAEYVERLCRQFDFGIPIASRYVLALRAWRYVFGRFPLLDSPAYHAIRAFSGWHRLPELFCGFERRPGKAPTNYPVACSPQAWASGAVFLILQSCLGPTIKAPESRIYLVRPSLPESIQEIEIRNLRVNDAVVKLRITRYDHSVSVDIAERNGHVEIVCIK